MPYNSPPRQTGFFWESYRRGKEKTMKHAIRIAILMFGLVGTYVLAAVPQVPAPDGGPICTNRLCKPISLGIVK